MVMAINGKPAKYTEALGDEICEAIASSELGLAHLCSANPHWPERSKIFKWRIRYPEFGHKYRKAKESQAHVCVEFMHELMNEPHVTIDPHTGLPELNVPMLRLKLDHFKWHAAKLQPKDYGDLKQLETINTEVDDDCKRRFAEMDEKNRKEC